MASTQLWSPAPGAAATRCPEGAIIIPKRGGAIGTNKKRITTRSTILDPNLMGIKGVDGKILTPFLYQWFQGFDLASITSGSSVPQLNKRDLDPLSLYTPPLELQEEFGSYAAKIALMKKRQSDSLMQLDISFASFQHRAFRGEI